MNQSKNREMRQIKNVAVVKTSKTPSKHRNIVKPSKSSGDPKLLKVSSATKLERRSQKNKNNSSALEETEVERAFRVHSRNQISQSQCALSLKLLGYNIGQKKEGGQFTMFWKRLNKTQIDFGQFFDLYYEMGQPQSLQRNYDVFELIAKGEKSISSQRLRTIADTVNWKGDIKQIMQFCGSNGNITFQQFSRAVKIGCAMF